MLRSPIRVYAILVFLTLATTATSLSARCIIDPCLSTATAVGFPTGIAVCPLGDGETLADKGARIDIVVKDPSGTLYPFMPAQDIWLIGCSDLDLCNGSYSSNADASTDMNGETTITGTMAVGGMASGVQVVVQGQLLVSPLNCSDPVCHALGVRSVDIDGSLAVDLVDLSVFAAGYPPNPYSAAGDFTFDGVVSLVDLAIFAAHFQHACQ